jgi:hypothetical protein
MLRQFSPCVAQITYRHGGEWRLPHTCTSILQENAMPKEPRTEQDRRASAQQTKPKGQKSSAERGSHTNNKKSSGKRPHSGGNAR